MRREIVNDNGILSVVLVDDDELQKGGAGSGNFGHSGIIGQRGGSSSGGGRLGGGGGGALKPPSKFLGNNVGQTSGGADVWVKPDTGKVFVNDETADKGGVAGFVSGDTDDNGNNTYTANYYTDENKNVGTPKTFDNQEDAAMYVGEQWSQQDLWEG